MVTYVLDNSALMSWLMPDERPAEIMRFFQKGRFEQFAVPPVWPFEFASAVGKARNLKRITDSDIQLILGLTSALQIEVMGSITTDLAERCLRDFLRTGLAPFDNSYLLLARELSLPLVTMDQKLRFIAQQDGILTPV